MCYNLFVFCNTIGGSKHQLVETHNCVLDFIRQSIVEIGYPPTHREIASACYISKSMVGHYLNKLEAQGKIVLTRGQARGIRLLDTNKT